jgi:hypothetical protein
VAELGLAAAVGRALERMASADVLHADPVALPDDGGGS